MLIFLKENYLEKTVEIKSNSALAQGGYFKSALTKSFHKKSSPRNE